MPKVLIENPFTILVDDLETLILDLGNIPAIFFKKFKEYQKLLKYSQKIKNELEYLIKKRLEEI